MTRVQILDEALSISHNANILWKDMDPIIVPTDIGKL